jgi:hypothetical protein
MKEVPYQPPRWAKVCSETHCQAYIDVGWSLKLTLRDDAGNPYEYLLAWQKEGFPIRPDFPPRASLNQPGI